MAYDHISLEQKWQKFWNDNHTFQTKNMGEKPKKYILDMFPYPSGAGLHVGHPKGYTATDIMSRYYHAKGYNVLHPMGFDAFGLPAENYAVKTGTHPRITTEANIATFTSQMKALGFSYDWDRMVDTTDPEYYKWTQWIFLELFKQGLAYEAEMPVNWCPALKAVLANEEVVDGKSEIGGYPVEKKLLRQWVLRITKYADRLIEDLDDLDWPEGIKEMQRNWIGKSEGCEFRLMKKVEGKPIALILHGWEGKAESNWFPATKKSLEDIGYNVIVPNLPHSATPNLQDQLDFLSQYSSLLSEDSVIIGHSLGGQLAIQFASKLTVKIGRLILVAPTYPGVAENMGITARSSQNQNEKAFIEYTSQGGDFTMLSKNVTKIVLHLSKDDPYISLEQAKDFYISISDSIIREYTSKGHFNESDGITQFPELLESLDHIRVYTTRVDTVYGMTYAVLAPDHPSVQDFITDEYRTICDQYIKNTKAKTDLDRTNEGKEKSGVFTGSYVINPYNGESVPLWIADYVLGSYGTGAVMAVPAHDERDFEFAEKYNLPVRQSVKLGAPGTISGSYIINYNLGIEDLISTSDKSGISFSESEKCYSSIKNAIIIGGNIEDLLELKLKYKIVEPINIFTDDGIVNVNGEISSRARVVFIEKAESEGFGQKKVNYKLRDWLFSRQRYWGEPIPLIHISHEDFESLPRISEMSEAIDPNLAYILDKKWTEKRCKNCTCEEGCTKLIIGGKTFSKVYDGLTGKLIIDSSLPLLLPEVEKYEPSGDGQSPLATVPEWVNIKLATNLSGKRETNTMPQWGGSCWYYLRYMDNKNSQALASREAMNYWGIVDEYVGGAEHAVLHLLYARFWHKVLYDRGIVPTKEPFQKLTNVGMILAYAYERTDGGLVAVDGVEEKEGKFFETATGGEVKQVVAKMSKSLKNVVNPNDIVREYGADTLRLYEMSMSGFTDTAPWNPEAIIGVRRFLDRIYGAFTIAKNIAKDDMKAMKLLHKTVKKVGEDIKDYKFNTAISSLMILLNEGIPKDEEFALEWKEKFTTLLHPFAPHMAEELWSMLGKTTSIYQAEWPEYDDFMLIDDEVTIAIQVNGKLRGTVTCLNGVMQEEVASLAHENPDILKWIEGKTLVKEIFIPNKMLSIVVRD